MQENNEIKHLDLVDIIPNRLQPRTEFDEEKLNELANSIKQYGVINPIIVRPVGNKYEIIAGERRYKASKIAGLTKIPVIISNMDERTSAEVAIIENIQRQDLTALEEAKSYRKLLDQGNITQEQLAHKMGKTQSTIANKMRLLNLCDEVQEALENNQISERHARSLLQLKDINDQRNMLEKIIKERMTVKMTEHEIKEMLQSKTLETNEIVNNNINPTVSPNENIYGNDVVSIMDLNKKELEKENDNMNNNDFNMQMAPGAMPNPSMEQPMSPTTPAFGDRFFPSLEDQETNLNLTNPFEMTTPAVAPVPTSQPMMENLVDTQPIVPPTPTREVEPAPMMPTVQPEPVASPVVEPTMEIPQPEIPSFVMNSQTVPPVAPLGNINETPEINLPPISDVQPFVPAQPEPIVAPMPQNDFVQNIPVPETPIMEPTLPNNDIVAEPIINPIADPIPAMPTPMLEVEPTPMMPPVQPEPVASPVVEPTMEIPQPEIITPPVEFQPPISNIEEPVMVPPVEAPVAPTQEEIPTLDNKPTDNIINAINALKNLGLSIQSIGYKATISEEDTPNTYKITIELEK